MGCTNRISFIEQWRALAIFTVILKITLSAPAMSENQSTLMLSGKKLSVVIYLEDFICHIAWMEALGLLEDKYSRI